MTDSGPLGRSSLSFRDKMVKYHAEIERLVYAAEVLCHQNVTRETVKKGICISCDFASVHGCILIEIRKLLGDHIEQHDPTEGQ